MRIVKQIRSDGEVVFEDGTTQVFPMDHEGVYYKVYFGEGEKMSKWWLISDEDVAALKNEIGKGWCYDATHTLDTALHKTDAVPTDHEKKETYTQENRDAGFDPWL